MAEEIEVKYEGQPEGWTPEAISGFRSLIHGTQMPDIEVVDSVDEAIQKATEWAEQNAQGASSAVLAGGGNEDLAGRTYRLVKQRLFNERYEEYLEQLEEDEE